MTTNGTSVHQGIRPFVVALLVLLYAVPVHAHESVTLQLKWVHQFQFAGYYAAKAKGYYKEANLAVTLVDAAQGREPVTEVLSGRAQYGVGTSSLLLIRSTGTPVVVLAAVFQHSPYILLSRRFGPVQDIRNLIGKRLMLEPQADELLAYLKKEGVSLNRLSLQEHKYTLDDLISGKVDAISGYSTDDPDQLDRAGFPYHLFSPRSAGIDFYGDNLFTTEREIKEHPDRVRAFREASLRGWQYALQHPEEIIDLILKEYAPKSSREHLRYEAAQITKLVDPTKIEIGYMYPQRWQDIADTYIHLGLLPEDYRLDDFVYDPVHRPDLTWLYRSIVLFLLLLVTVAVIRLIKITRDLRQSRQLFFKAFDQAPLGKIITRAQDGTILDVNQHFCKISGYCREEVVGKTSLELGLITPEERTRIVRFLQSADQTEGIEISSMTKNGTKRHCIYFGEQITVDGQPLNIAIMQDITRIKQAEVTLRKLSRAIEQSPVSIVITDHEGTVEFVNPQFTRMTGYSSDEIMGINLRILKSGTMLPAFYQKLWDSISSGQIWEGELFNRKKDGSKYWEHATISPIRGATGQITHYLAFKEDITKQKLLWEQLIQSQKMESVGQLAGGLAHDFNNLLAVIDGYATLLQLKLDQQKDLQQLAVHIQSATEKAATLTHGLLAYSRQQIIQLQHHDLRQLVCLAEEFLGRILGDAISLQIICADQPLTIHADSLQIEQVLFNLAANARDAMPEGGSFSIETSLAAEDDSFFNASGLGPAEGYALLSVTDTGCGMDNETIKRLFDPFFTTKQVGKGTGLGLSVAYGIIRQHNGHIQVQSRPGKGTVFWIYLPLCTCDGSL